MLKYFLFIALFVVRPIYGNYMIAPNKITFNKDVRVESLALTNNHNESKNFQLSLFKVEGSSFNEKLIPSKDLLITPVMFEIKPGQKQVIRVARTQKDTDTALNGKYKLSIKELPKQTLKGGNYVHFAVELVVPITFGN